MYKRQFVFSPSKVNLLDKDLYDEISYEEDKAYLTLKNNVKIGYADSFSDAMYSIGDISDHFIPNSIEEITLFNGFSLLKGKGVTTSDTVMDLTCDFWNYALLDNQKVTIETKGTLNPAQFIKGHFTGYFEEEFKRDGDTIEAEYFSSVRGDSLPVLLQNDKRVYRSNMVTSVFLQKSSYSFLCEIRYLTVESESGILYKSPIVTFTNEDKLFEYLSKNTQYKDLIESALFSIK